MSGSSLFPLESSRETLVEVSGGECGQRGEPDAFAATLRQASVSRVEVLAPAGPDTTRPQPRASTQKL
jgi:hypothetical protein